MIILCLIGIAQVNCGFFDGMNVGLTIPAMQVKVPAPSLPKIKVNADIKMPKKQSLKSMLPKFKYNIPTFGDDYYPMHYAASSSNNHQSAVRLNKIKPMNNQNGYEMEAQTSNQIKNQFNHQMKDQMRNQFNKQMGNQIRNQFNHLNYQPNNRLNRPVDTRLPNSDLKNQASNQNFNHPNRPNNYQNNFQVQPFNPLNHESRLKDKKFNRNLQRLTRSRSNQMRPL